MKLTFLSQPRIVIDDLKHFEWVAIIGTGLLLLHQPHQPRKTSRNLVSTTIHNFRYEGRRSIALVLLLTKLWGVGYCSGCSS